MVEKRRIQINPRASPHLEAKTNGMEDNPPHELELNKEPTFIDKSGKEISILDLPFSAFISKDQQELLDSAKTSDQIRREAERKYGKEAISMVDDPRQEALSEEQSYHILRDQGEHDPTDKRHAIIDTGSFIFKEGEQPKFLKAQLVITEKSVRDAMKAQGRRPTEGRTYVTNIDTVWDNKNYRFIVPKGMDYNEFLNMKYRGPDGLEYSLESAIAKKYGKTPENMRVVSQVLKAHTELKQKIDPELSVEEQEKAKALATQQGIDRRDLPEGGIGALMHIGGESPPPHIPDSRVAQKTATDKGGRLELEERGERLTPETSIFEDKNLEKRYLASGVVLPPEEIKRLIERQGTPDKKSSAYEGTAGLTPRDEGYKSRNAHKSILETIENLKGYNKTKYNNIPQAEREQFKADVEWRSKTDEERNASIANNEGHTVEPGFQKRYQDILVKTTIFALNEEQISGTPSFDKEAAEQGKFVPVTYAEGQGLEAERQLENAIQKQRQRDALLQPNYLESNKRRGGYSEKIVGSVQDLLNYQANVRGKHLGRQIQSENIKNLPLAEQTKFVEDYVSLLKQNEQPSQLSLDQLSKLGLSVAPEVSEVPEGYVYDKATVELSETELSEKGEPYLQAKARQESWEKQFATPEEQQETILDSIDVTKGTDKDGNFFNEMASLGLKTEVGPLKDKYGQPFESSRFKIGSFEEELSHHPRDKYVVDDMGKRIYGSTIGFKQDIADKLMERARREISRTEEQGVRDAIIKRYEEGDWKPDKEHIDIDDPRVSQEIRDKIVEEAGVRRRHPGEREEDKRRRELANLVRRPLYSGRQKPDIIHDFDGQRIKETAESQWLAKKYAEGWKPDDVKRYQQQEDLRGWEERFGDKKREKELESFYLNKKQKERVVPENMNTGRNLSQEAEDIAESLKRRNLIDDDIKRSKAQSTLYRQRVENLYTKPKTSSQDGTQHEDSEVDFKIEDSIDESLSNTSKVVDLSINESRILQLQPNMEFDLNGAKITTSAQTMFKGKPSSTIQIRNKETGKTELKDIFYLKENPRVFSGGNYEFVSRSNVGGQGQPSTHEAEHVQDNVSQTIKDIDAKKNFYKAEDEPTYSNSSNIYTKSMANGQFERKQGETEKAWKKRLEQEAQDYAFATITAPSVAKKAQEAALKRTMSKGGRIKAALSARRQTITGESGQKGRGVMAGMSALMHQRHQQKMQQAQLDAITGRGRGRGKRDTVMDAIAMAQSLTQPQQQQFGGGQGLFSSQGTQQMMGSGQSRLTDFSIQGTSRGSALTDFAGRVGTQGLGLGSNLAGQMMSGEGTRGIFTTGKEFLQSRGQPSGMQFVGQRERDIMSFSLGGTLGLGGSMRPEQGLGSPSGFLAGELISQTQTQNRAPNGRNNGAGFRGRNNR